MKSLVKLIAIAFLFTGCKKVIQLDLTNNADKLVIEGNITNQAGPYFVKITKSVNFNQTNTYPPVTNAFVVITDNTNLRDTLTYAGNGNYKTNKLIGVEGRTYTLTVTAEGKNYSAKSTMPAFISLDSLRLSYSIANGKERVNVIPRYADPSVLGNSYRFIQKINNKLDETYYVFNDNLNNGLPNQRPLRSSDPDLELLKGDQVQVEMQCISPDTYAYFYSLGQQSGGGFRGGSAPANPPNNIIGDALGIFSAHTSQIKTVRIP